MKLRSLSSLVVASVVTCGFHAELAHAQATPTPSWEDDEAQLAATTPPCYGAPLCFGQGEVAAWPVLSFRSGYELQQPSARVGFVGRNDGFRVDQLWAGLDARAASAIGTFEARLVLDGASVLPGAAPNQPVRRLGLAAADAYLAWRPFGGDLAVRLGQQRMPADKEGLTELGGFVFATRSVLAAGVEPGRGFATRGMSPGRQLGLVVEDAWLLPLGFRVAYAGGVGNGNGTNQRVNDNPLPSLHLRLEAGFRELARLAVGGRYNPRTVGSLPIQQQESVTGGFLEAGAGAFGFELLALAHLESVSLDSALPDPQDPNHSRLGYGGTGWLLVKDPFGFESYGVRGGYRVSYYAPAVALPDEALLEHAFAIRYDPGYLPYTSFIVDFTSLWSLDDAGLVSADGNRVFALVHVEL